LVGDIRRIDRVDNCQVIVDRCTADAADAAKDQMGNFRSKGVRICHIADFDVVQSAHFVH
jgi:hypothetical protein